MIRLRYPLVQFSASITLMFREYPLLKRFQAARDAGFGGVEIQRLDEGNPKQMAAAARDAGVEVVLINVDVGDYAEGGLGLSGVPGREKQFMDAVYQTLDIAEELGRPLVHVGPSRVPPDGFHGVCLATYYNNVADAAEAAKIRGVRLTIEAMNRVEAPAALFNDVADVALFIRQRLLGFVGLQYDFYHVGMNGQDGMALFPQYLDLVEHVQFADFPGRHEPGTGRLDFDALLSSLEGYTGWVGAEYRPTRPTEETLGWLPYRSDSFF
jgi:hydroxypyruvate isomerase